MGGLASTTTNPSAAEDAAETFLLGWGFTGPGFLDEEVATEYFNANQLALERILLLERQGPPIDELRWLFELTRPAPLDTSSRTFGDREFDSRERTTYVKLRELGRSSFPLWTAEALSRGEPETAWERLIALHYFSRAQTAMDRSLVGAMIAIAVENLVHDAARLLFEDAPPSQEVATRLAQRADAALLARNYAAGVQADYLTMLAAFEFAAKDRRALPVDWGGGTSFGDLLGMFESGASTGVRPYPLLENLQEALLHTYLAPRAVDAQAITLELGIFHSAASKARDHGLDYDKLERRLLDNIFTAMGIPSFSRANKIAAASATTCDVIRAVALLRLKELETPPGEVFIPPASLDALFREHGYPLPLDRTADADNTPLEYQVETEVGVVAFHIAAANSVRGSSKFTPATEYWPFGSQHLRGTVTSHSTSTTWPNWLELTVRLASGREVRVRVLPSLATMLKLPGEAAPGTVIEFRKRPRSEEGALVFDAYRVGDVQIIQSDDAGS